MNLKLVSESTRSSWRLHFGSTDYLGRTSYFLNFALKQHWNIALTLLCFEVAPVDQKVKRWPADLAVMGSRPAEGRNLFNRKRGSITHRLSLSLSNRPDMTEILLNDVKLQSIHPFCI